MTAWESGVYVCEREKYIKCVCLTQNAWELEGLVTSCWSNLMHSLDLSVFLSLDKFAVHVVHSAWWKYVRANSSKNPKLSKLEMRKWFLISDTRGGYWKWLTANLWGHRWQYCHKQMQVEKQKNLIRDLLFLSTNVVAMISHESHLF